MQCLKVRHYRAMTLILYSVTKEVWPLCGGCTRCPRRRPWNGGHDEIWWRFLKGGPSSSLKNTILKGRLNQSVFHHQLPPKSLRGKKRQATASKHSSWGDDEGAFGSLLLVYNTNAQYFYYYCVKNEPSDRRFINSTRPDATRPFVFVNYVLIDNRLSSIY
jgi:hypothetical protein